MTLIRDSKFLSLLPRVSRRFILKLQKFRSSDALGWFDFYVNGFFKKMFGLLSRSLNYLLKNEQLMNVKMKFNEIHLKFSFNSDIKWHNFHFFKII